MKRVEDPRLTSPELVFSFMAVRGGDHLRWPTGLATDIEWSLAMLFVSSHVEPSYCLIYGESPGKPSA